MAFVKKHWPVAAVAVGGLTVAAVATNRLSALARRLIAETSTNRWQPEGDPHWHSGGTSSSVPRTPVTDSRK